MHTYDPATEARSNCGSIVPRDRELAYVCVTFMSVVACRKVQEECENPGYLQIDG